MATLQFTATKPLDSSTPALVFSGEKSVRSLRAEMNWGSSQDIDISAVGVSASGQCVNFAHLSCYVWNASVTKGTIPASTRDQFIQVLPDGSYQSIDGGVKHSPDVRNGATQSADEWMEWLLANIPMDVVAYPIIASIYSDDPTANFGKITDATFTLKDDQGKVMQAYTLNKDFGNAKVVVLGILRKSTTGTWEFQPKGDASPSHGLIQALQAYGVPF